MLDLSLFGLVQWKSKCMLDRNPLQAAADFFLRIHRKVQMTMIELNMRDAFLHHDYSYCIEESPSILRFDEKTETNGSCPRPMETVVREKENRTI
jgi:hypothetical protein